jgi:peptidoglycan glycosyltransferase
MKEIRDVRGTVVRQPEDREWRRAMTEETASIMKGLMVNVVRSGTGRRAQIAGIEVGGKTGTAQAGQEGVAPHAWFIAFAGDANPRIAVAVIVENGGELGSEATGGVVAAPIAKAVIEAHRSVAGW